MDRITLSAITVLVLANMSRAFATLDCDNVAEYVFNLPRPQHRGHNYTVAVACVHLIWMWVTLTPLMDHIPNVPRIFSLPSN